MADYDSPWKEILDAYFEWFLAFYFPEVHRAIDWARPVEFLDKELQQIEREAELGRQVVDKLARVWLKDGQEVWVLVHIEIQSQYESDFGQRMYVYNYRLFDKYNTRVISLAVLGDDRPNWRPNQFGHELCGCSVRFQFPTVKLLDYGRDEAALEAHENPFGVVTLAHLKTMETHGDDQARHGWKFRLIRNLFERGLTKEKVWQLFRFIDWIMELPKERELQLRQEIDQLAKEKQMPYVTSLERINKEEGIREGLVAGIAKFLEGKFGTADLDLMRQIGEITDFNRLQAIAGRIATATSTDEVKQFLLN